MAASELIKAGQAAQNRPLPTYAKQLIGDLTVALDRQIRYTEAIKIKAAEEVDEVRAILAGDPEGADTFASMPRTTVGYDETEDRPIGTGITIEYRAPDMGPGEGFEVSLKDGRLHVRGINTLAVVPVHSSELWIEVK